MTRAMRQKAKFCADCRHWTRTGPPCALGHKPRWYMPRNDGGHWGWKRRCEDFRVIEGL